MYLPSLAGLSLTGPSHCRPCATDKVVEYEDKEALSNEGGKYIAEFADEPGKPARPGCAICQLPFEPGRDGGDVIILSCGHAFHLNCMTSWGQGQRARNLPVTCPLCNGHPTVAEQRELGLEIDPMEELFEAYLSGNNNGWIQFWKSTGNTYLLLSDLAIQPPYFTGDRRGMSYMEAMVQAWARKSISARKQTKILDYIFTELEWMDLNTDEEEEPRPRLLRWDENTFVSLFAGPQDNLDGRLLSAWQIQGKGWTAISKRADANREFKDVFRFIYHEIGMTWEPETIKYNVFEYDMKRLRELFFVSDMTQSYRDLLDEWYPKAMSYGFEYAQALVVEFARELGTAPKVDVSKLQKLTMFLDKFGGEELPRATSFEKIVDPENDPSYWGDFDHTSYDMNEQFNEEKDSLEYVANALRMTDSLDPMENDGGAEWDDEFDVYGDALTNKEKWERLDRILVFDRSDQSPPGMYQAELRRFRDVLVTKYRQVLCHIWSNMSSSK